MVIAAAAAAAAVTWCNLTLWGDCLYGNGFGLLLTGL